VIHHQSCPAKLHGVDITVCICTHNRPAYLRDCLEGLRSQTESPGWFEILIVDSASTGDAPARVARLASDIVQARLLRVDKAGVSVARNAGAAAALGSYIAYIDDDAIPAPDWVERILAAIQEGRKAPALPGGRILPQWEAPLPGWWPDRLRGVLSIIEFEGRGEYRTAALPPNLAPYGANVVVHVPTLLAMGGFSPLAGRVGTSLLSDEEVQLAWRLQAAGFSARYDSRLVVRHQIQASRLTPTWLLSRLYWQGVSTVLTRNLLGERRAVWRELPRRIVLAFLLAPLALLPKHSPRLLAGRWRLAYAAGFLRGAIGPSLAIGA
jgi:glycosyltransferase involved in cell wall biosynthesis